MLAAVVQVQDLDVGGDVGVVEHQAVQADAVVELEAVGDAPVVLEVEAGLIEAHPGGGLGLAVIAVSQGHGLRHAVVQEVLQGGIAVVAGTVAHVVVVRHLVLEAGAGGNLVGAGVPGEVVLHGKGVVVHRIGPGEELVTRADVRKHLDHRAGGSVCIAEDVDVRELLGIGTADIADHGISGEELVGEDVRQAAVQVQGPGLHPVVHRVHVVRERHAVLGDAGVGRRHLAVGGGGVRSQPVLVVRVVVAEGQVVLLRDVPVDAAENLHVRLEGREVGVGTGVIAVVPPELVLHGLKVGRGDAGDVLVDVHLAVLGGAPAEGRGRGIDILEVHEEEELVLHDRAAEGHAVGGLPVDLAGSQFLFIHAVSVHVLVLVVHVGRSLELVRTGLGDRVHAAADEVRLADVERGDHHLHFLDGVDGNRGAAAREGGGQAEVVVEVRAVHREVHVTAVGSGEAHPVTAVRRDLRDVRDAAGDRRHREHVRLGDVRGGAGLLLRRELGRRRRDDHGLGEELVGLADLRVQVVRLGQLERDLRVVHLLVTQAGDLHAVGAAGTHTLDGVEAITVRHRTVGGPGRLVDGHDGGADHRLAVLVHHAAAEGRRRHLGEGGDTRQHGQCRERKAFEGISHKLSCYLYSYPIGEFNEKKAKAQ